MLLRLEREYLIPSKVENEPQRGLNTEKRRKRIRACSPKGGEAINEAVVHSTLLTIEV